MVDITQPSILGYPITPWFIVLCACVIGTIVFAILLVLGLSKRESREYEMIENAAKKTSNIPVKNIEIPSMDFSIDGQDGTESIVGGKTDRTEPFKTEGFDSSIEGLTDGTEGFDVKNEGLDLKTEGLDLKTKGFAPQTEGLVFNSGTEAFDTNSTEAFTADRSEGFDGEDSDSMKRKSKFCWKCGNKVSANFCSHCGQKLI